MYFDEGRHLNPPQFGQSDARDQIHRTLERSHEMACNNSEKFRNRISHFPPPKPNDWETGKVLDATNNKLQEILQLLYLLSRDQSVPKDARYHVTVAQSEMALLARTIQNAADEDATAEDRPEARPFLVNNP